MVLAESSLPFSFLNSKTGLEKSQSVNSLVFEEGEYSTEPAPSRPLLLSFSSLFKKAISNRSSPQVDWIVDQFQQLIDNSLCNCVLRLKLCWAGPLLGVSEVDEPLHPHMPLVRKPYQPISIPASVSFGI